MEPPARELVNRNRSLRRIRIDLSLLPKNQVAIDLVKTFLKSPMLGKLEVVSLRHRSAESIPEIATVCRAQKFKRFCVSVYGVSYFLCKKQVFIL